MRNLKTSFTLSIALLWICNISAQTGPRFVFGESRDAIQAQTLMSTGVDVVTASDGSYYVLGDFQNNDFHISGATIPSTSYQNTFVLKYDSLNQLQWTLDLDGGNAIFGNEGIGIALTPQEEILIGGNFRDTLFRSSSTPLVSSGNGDFYLAKISKSGSLLWAKSYGHPSHGDWLSDLTVDQNGDIYICGTFSSDTLILQNKSLPKQTNGDFFAAKLHPDGLTQWVKGPDMGSARTFGKAIAVNDSGDVVIGGYFEGGPLSIQGQTAMEYGNDDIWLGQLNAGDGTLRWVKTSGGAHNDRIWGLALDQKGNSYLIGNFNSQTFFIEHDTLRVNCNLGFLCTDFVLAKFNKAGGLEWSRQSEAPQQHASSLYDIELDKSGNVYVAGNYGDQMNLDHVYFPDPGSGIRAMAFKMSPKGKILWARYTTGTQNEWFKGLSVAPDSSIYLTGSFRGSVMVLDTINLSNNSTRYQYVLSKISPCWQEGVGLPDTLLASDYNGDSVFVYTNPPLIQTCWSNGSNQDTLFIPKSAIGDSTIQISFTGVDLYGCEYSDSIFILDPKVGLRQTAHSARMKGIDVFPNPFFDAVHVDVPNRTLSYQLVDVTGQLIREGSLEAGTTVINTTHLNKGVYLMRLFDANFRHTVLLIKSNDALR